MNSNTRSFPILSSQRFYIFVRALFSLHLLKFFFAHLSYYKFHFSSSFGIQNITSFLDIDYRRSIIRLMLQFYIFQTNKHKFKSILEIDN